ncbi:MAG: FtsX-like permease family protein [Erysipelothrix sp.]|nr:FtsX-like permease family protein [Erysipelothrix sp.]
MVKKSYYKDILREIKNRLPQFISTIIILALGISFYIGIQMTGIDMRVTADSYYQDNRNADLEVTTSLGVDESFKKEIETLLSDVETELFYYVDKLVIINEKEVNLRIYQVPKRMNQFSLLVGSEPVSQNQIVIDSQFAKFFDVKLGNKVTLIDNDQLKSEQLEIVGFGNSSRFLTYERGRSTVGNGQLDGFGYVSMDAFEMDVANGLSIRFHDLENAKFDDSEYKNSILSQKAILNTNRDRLVNKRLSDLLHDPQKELEDAKNKLIEETTKAQADLDKANQQLIDGKQLLDQGLDDFNKGVTSVYLEIEQEPVFEDSPQATLNRLNQQIAIYFSLQQEKITEAQKEINQGQVDANNGLKTIEENIADLNEKKSELTTQIKILNETVAAMEASNLVLVKNQKSLDELRAAVINLQFNQAKYEEGLNAFYNGLVAIKTQLQLDVVFVNDPVVDALEVSSSVDQTVIALNENLAAIDQSIIQVEQMLLVQPDNFDLIAQKEMLIQQKELIEVNLNQLEVVQTEVKKLIVASNQLSESKLQLDAGWSFINPQISAIGSLEDAQAQLDFGKEELRKGIDSVYNNLLLTNPLENDLSKALVRLSDDIKSFEQNQNDLIENGLKTLDTKKTEVVGTLEMLQQAQQTLNQSQIDLDSGRNQLSIVSKELQMGVDKYQKGLEEYQKGVVDYQEGLATFEKETKEAKKKISDAQKELDALKKPELFVSTRNEFMIGYQSFENDSYRIEKIGQIFPLFFFLIAALVSLSTMTRMVEDQKIQMGVMSALGYTKRMIRNKFLIYGLGVLIFSLLIGSLFGYLFFPRMIYDAYRILYEMPPLRTPFSWKVFLMPLFLSVLVTLVVAYIQAQRLLKMRPSQMMRANPPHVGKRVLIERITPLWKRLSFLQKVTLRNIFRHKSRFFMTTVGIAGCTGLLITGFGLYDSIMKIPVLQFQEINQYQMNVIYKDDIEETTKNEIKDYLGSQHATVVDNQMVSIEATNSLASVDASLYIFENDEEVSKVFSLHQGDNKVILDDKGVIVNTKQAELLGLTIGDTIHLINPSKNLKVDVTINGLVDNYVGHNVYLKRNLANQLGITNQNNSLLVKSESSDVLDIDAIMSKLLMNEDVLSVIDISTIYQSVNESMESFFFVIVVIVIAAALLAFVVMFNLSTMNLTERQREIATLKVLGFNQRETFSYLSRENVLLTLVGICVGCAFGYLLHQYVIFSAEIDTIMFYRQLTLRSVMISSVLTILFSLINDVIMSFQVKKINMLESLKSVE